MSDRIYKKKIPTVSRKGTAVAIEEEQKQTRGATAIQAIFAAAMAAKAAADAVASVIVQDGPAPADAPAPAGQWTEGTPKEKEKSKEIKETKETKETKADPKVLPDPYQEKLRQCDLAYKNAGYTNMCHTCVECLINPHACSISMRNEITNGEFFVQKTLYGNVLHTQGFVSPIYNPHHLALLLDNAGGSDAENIARMNTCDFGMHDHHRNAMNEPAHVNVFTLADPTKNPNDGYVTLAGLVYPPTKKQILQWIAYHKKIQELRSQYFENPVFEKLKATRDILATFCYRVPVAGNTWVDGKWKTLFSNPASWFCPHHMSHPNADPNKVTFYPNGTVASPAYVQPLQDENIQQIVAKYALGLRGTGKFSGSIQMNGSPKYMCSRCCDPTASCDRKNPRYFHRTDNIRLPSSQQVDGAYRLYQTHKIYHEAGEYFNTHYLCELEFVPSGKYPQMKITIPEITVPEIPHEIVLAVKELQEQREQRKEQRKEQSKIDTIAPKQQPVSRQPKIIITGGRFSSLRDDDSAANADASVQKPGRGLNVSDSKIRMSVGSWADDADDAEQKGTLGNPDAELSVDDDGDENDGDENDGDENDGDENDDDDAETTAQQVATSGMSNSV